MTPEYARQTIDMVEFLAGTKYSDRDVSMTAERILDVSNQAAINFTKWLEANPSYRITPGILIQKLHDFDIEIRETANRKEREQNKNPSAPIFHAPQTKELAKDTAWALRQYLSGNITRETFCKSAVRLHEKYPHLGFDQTTAYKEAMAI